MGQVKVVDRQSSNPKTMLSSEHRLDTKPFGVLFSTVFDTLHPRQLAEWIIEDRLPVRFQLQMHKYLWDPNARGV